MKSEIVFARCDGNRTVLHTAVMSAFATTNKDDSDTADFVFESDKRSLAEQHGLCFEFNFRRCPVSAKINF